MARILKAINESCVTRAEFPFSKGKKQHIDTNFVFMKNELRLLEVVKKEELYTKSQLKLNPTIPQAEMIISATFLPQVIYLGLLITKPFEDIFTAGHFLVTHFKVHIF